MSDEALLVNQIVAMSDMVGRTGAESLVMQEVDVEGTSLQTNIAVACYSGNRHESAAGPDQHAALERLCNQLVDGGLCTYCNRPTAFELDHDKGTPLDKLLCWYVFDPELNTIRRGCEGSNG